ncbi:MAG TPA: PD-(D/E)XK nuclease family protein, partial [Eoetvoesiella sp.]
KRAQVKVSDKNFVELLTQMTPQLALAWQACIADEAGRKGSHTIDVWVARFRGWLQALGYPGQAALSSHAYQVVQAFDDLLDRLGRQTTVLGSLSLGAAVSVLARLARETPFQPERDPAARLDVLGFLESEGGRWDGVWVLGLTDEILPATPKPNPLIPLATLRQANAPRATPERELQWAQAIYGALLCCAPAVWVSHAQREGERELRPSPFIARLDCEEQIPVPPASNALALEYLSDEQGPALQAGSITRGGIGVIDTQARNPLWAFVKYRLGASELNDYADISDQNARGLFLHRAIELVWRMVADQGALQQLHSNGRAADLIDQAVQQAADECLQEYGPVLRELETARAVKILDAWLLLELRREPFRIRDVEQDYRWSHGALELTLRLDRIDELDDGRLAVIDYKSGNGNIDPRSSWMRPRPVGLQLPFYAAVLANDDAQVAALVLAKLHAKKIEIKGLADAGYGFEGLAFLKDWPEFSGYGWDQLMAQWRQTIEQLAQEYVDGVARNQVLRPDDLQFCDALPFLRLTEESARVD